MLKIQCFTEHGLKNACVHNVVKFAESFIIIIFSFHQNFRSSFFLQKKCFPFRQYSLALYFLQKNIGTKAARTTKCW